MKTLNILSEYTFLKSAGPVSYKSFKTSAGVTYLGSFYIKKVKFVLILEITIHAV